MTAIWKALHDVEGPLMAVLRPIVRSEPVIPLETAEINGAGLADARQLDHLDSNRTTTDDRFRATEHAMLASPTA